MVDRMKKKDILLGLGVVFIALMMLLVMKITGSADGNQVRIMVDGREYGVYSLNEDQEIEIKDGEDYNKIRISDGEVFMVEADCPDGYCIKQGKIKGRKQTIVCLPHKLVVEVTEMDGSDDTSGMEAPDTVAK